MDLSNAYAISAMVDKHEKYLKDCNRISNFISELSESGNDNKFIISIDGGIGTNTVDLRLDLSEDRGALEALMHFCNEKMGYYHRGIENFVQSPFSDYRSKDDVIIS